MVETLGEQAMSVFDSEVKGIPDSLCAPFQEAAGRLEVAVLTIFRVVSICQREEEDLGRVAEMWGRMTDVCDLGLTKLSGLVSNHPHCNAEFFRDRMLDLRNKCQRLKQLHA